MHGTYYRIPRIVKVEGSFFRGDSLIQSDTEPIKPKQIGPQRFSATARPSPDFRAPLPGRHGSKLSRRGCSHLINALLWRLLGLAVIHYPSAKQLSYNHHQSLASGLFEHSYQLPTITINGGMRRLGMHPPSASCVLTTTRFSPLLSASAVLTGSYISYTHLRRVQYLFLPAVYFFTDFFSFFSDPSVVALPGFIQFRVIHCKYFSLCCWWRWYDLRLPTASRTPIIRLAFALDSSVSCSFMSPFDPRSLGDRRGCCFVILLPHVQPVRTRGYMLKATGLKESIKLAFQFQ
ncbi:uncharacterized protein EI90DRAFT_3101806 [Cantharellus anzutake]|uniref:uncharacterized protein n=1 Tax=Cantharellus anzutake TaxID=1750568 RepID=UPI0019084146|nr:uncharacterized protein EI90DRAFT_3101806 [Cantharellus anzutake]KAF8310241.1 hypothetical protein EI90DRAFT_3101806 [Cantharellus anzutake]